jgi:hypothetical protein
LVPKSVFDDAVFEGMETEDYRASAGRHPLGERPGQKLLEVFEFVIDGNPQGLKDPRGGMDFVTSLRPAGQGLRDGCDEIRGRPMSDLGPPGDDRTGDRAAGALFSELLKQLGQLGFAQGCKEFRGGRSRGGVKTHVERPAARHSALNAEPAQGVGQLVGRQAQVEQNAVDGADSKRVEDLRQLGITGVFQSCAGFVEDLRGPREHFRIAVQTDQFSVGSKLL